MSSNKCPGYLLYIGDYIVLSCIGILVSNYKDPYEPIRIMESRKGFERCSNVLGSKVPLISMDPLLITVYMRIF